MISYKPFYDTLFRKRVTEYALIYKFGIPANTIHRMKHGKPISTTTLDTLCGILDCTVEEILLYIKDEDERQASIGIVNGQRLYSTTPEIQAFTDVNSAAKYFQYTNQWGKMVTPIDKDSFEGIKLSVLRELSEGIKWARDSFNIGSDMPRTIRRAQLGNKTLGDYDDVRREVRYKLGLSEEYAYSTAVHKMAHHADNIMGHPAGDIVKAAIKKLREQYSIKQLNRMKDEIAMAYSNDVHELLAYSLDKYCIGKGNILAKTISEEFLRRCRER